MLYQVISSLPVILELSDQLSHFQDIYQGRHYLLYSAPRKRLPGFLQTLHSVKEMKFVKAISQQVHVLYKGTGKVRRTE